MHIIYQSLKNRRFVNPHVRIIRPKALEKLLGEYGKEIEDYVYISLLPPLVSRAYFWPHVFSLIAVSGRMSNNPASQPV